MIPIFSCRDTQHGNELKEAEGEAQGEDVVQANKEDTSCKSNSTIESAVEPADSAANDTKPSPTGNTDNKDDDSQVQKDPADNTQTENKVYCIVYLVSL